MLNTKFRGNQSTGSRAEDFLRAFTLCGRRGHLGHVTLMWQTNFRSAYPQRLHTKFGFDWPSCFGEDV